MSQSSSKIKNGVMYGNVLHATMDILKKPNPPVTYAQPKMPIFRWTNPQYALTRSAIVRLSDHNRFSDHRWSGVFHYDEEDGVAGSYWGESNAVIAEIVYHNIHENPTKIKGYGTLPVLTHKGRVVLEPIAFQKGVVLLCEITRQVKMVDIKGLIERLSEYSALKSLGAKGLESAVFDPDDYSSARAISAAITLTNRELWSKLPRVEELYQGLIARSARIDPREQANNVVFLELPGRETMLPLEPKAVIWVRSTDTKGKVHFRYVPLDPNGTNQQQIVERVVKNQEAFWTEGKT